MLVIQHQPHGSLAHFRGKLVRRLAHDGSTFSGVGASGKPGAVQYPQLEGDPATTSLFCHSIAFMGCTFVAEHLMREAHPGEVAQLVAENHDDAKRYIQDAHGIFRNPAEVKRRGMDDKYLPLERIRNNVLFSEKSECKPLQLADACAFIIRMHLRGDEPLIEPYYQQIKPWLSVVPKGEEPYVAPIGPAYPYGPLVEHYGE